MRDHVRLDPTHSTLKTCRSPGPSLADPAGHGRAQVTPTTMRLRKQILDSSLRKRGTKTLAGDRLV